MSDYINTRTKKIDFVVFPNLTDEVTESLINIDSLLGGRLNEFASKMFCQVTALYHQC